jgi:hypothetical protein
MHKNFKIRIIIVICLIITLAILIFLKFGSGKKKTDEITLQKTEVKKTINYDNLRNDIIQKLDSIYFSFGIKKEWISDFNPAVKIKTDKKPKSDTTKITKVKDDLWFQREIQLPPDLPTFEVNVDVNEFLGLNNLKSEITEEFNKVTNTASVEMQVWLGDSTKKLIGKISYKTNKELKRSTSEICIVIAKLEKLSSQELDRLIGTTEKFTFILPDEIELSEVQSKIFDSKKDYILLFDVGSDKDIDADFRSDMPEKEWKSKIKSISYEYTKASAIILNSRRPNLKIQNDVKAEFQKHNKNIFLDTIFIKFDGKEKSGAKINNLLNDIVYKTANGYKDIYYLLTMNGDEVEEFTKESYKLKKKGFKFRSFSEMNLLSKEK